MKIIFLCGSLEPGKDGVGDYTHRLASELAIRGHQCSIVALMDKFIDVKIEELEIENKLFKIIRLPFRNGYKSNIKEAGKWLDICDPEWISLQYVPFAFHHKGLPFGMSKMLARFGAGRNWHIMIHELWVGMDVEADLKFICWGWVQRQMIKTLLVNLRPTVIHTQCAIYMRMLEKIGFKPQLLPLFGNIIVLSNGFNKVENSREAGNNDNSISFVVFGSIHHGAPIGELARELKLYSQDSGVNVKLKIIGRCGPEQLHWEQACKAVGLPVEFFGEQPWERISEVLSSSTFGISTTPASLVEKSGSLAAMREHGLTILCISRPWHPRGIKEIELPTGVVQYEKGKIQEFISGNVKIDPVNNITDIVEKFVSNLLLSIKHGEL